MARSQTKILVLALDLDARQVPSLFHASISFPVVSSVHPAFKRRTWKSVTEQFLIVRSAVGDPWARTTHVAAAAAGCSKGVLSCASESLVLLLNLGPIAATQKQNTSKTENRVGAFGAAFAKAVSYAKEIVSNARFAAVPFSTSSCAEQLVWNTRFLLSLRSAIDARKNALLRFALALHRRLLHVFL